MKSQFWYAISNIGGMLEWKSLGALQSQKGEGNWSCWLENVKVWSLERGPKQTPPNQKMPMLSVMLVQYIFMFDWN
jgi:hypothetical protein